MLSAAPSLSATTLIQHVFQAAGPAHGKDMKRFCAFQIITALSEKSDRSPQRQPS